MTVRMNDTISQMCILYIRVDQMQIQTIYVKKSTGM